MIPSTLLDQDIVFGLEIEYTEKYRIELDLQ